MAEARGVDLHLELHDGTASRIIVGVRSVDGLPMSSRDMIDKSSAGATARTFVPGLQNNTFTINGIWDDTTSTGSATVLGTIADDTATRAFIFGPEGSTTGDVKYSGNAYVTAFTISEAYDGIAEFAASFQVDGAVTVGTF
jgi:predicted secreted protein